MNILIIGYICVVAISAFIVNKTVKTTRISEARLANYKTWLEESNHALFAARDQVSAAHQELSDQAEILHKYGHYDDPVADEISSAINDSVACAGLYYDDDGNPMLDELDWTPQEGVTYSESDDSDV